MSKSEYRPDVDGLRAIAIIVVVIFHAFPEQLSGGFTGVDVFFVISGYVIAKTSQKYSTGVHSGVKFLKIRLARIYLGYWPFFLLASIEAYFNPTIFAESINYFQAFFLAKPVPCDDFLQKA